MLIRLFRLTDKFSNAFLKVAVWLSHSLLMQFALLRQTTEESIVGLYTGTKRSVNVVTRSSRDAYDATDTRRRSLMAQRAAIVTTDGGVIQPAIIEDPLIRQNRTLSVFAVLLMAALIAIVLWATNQNTGNTGTFNSGGRAFLPQNTIPPTAPIFNTPVPTTTPVPQPLNWRGTLTFSLRQNGQEDLFAFQRGDSQPLRLTNSPSDERDPAWSPDGRTLAFVSNRDGTWELYVMDIIDKQVRRLTVTSAYEGSPTWSPDGTFLAYESYDNRTNNLDIYVVAVDGSGACPCRVTSQPGADFEPSWMPELADGGGGRLIAYTSVRGSQQDIFLINLDNPSDDAAINLTRTSDIDEDHAAWSPNGVFVAYSARVDGIEGVYYRSIDDPLTEFAVGRGRMPVWNPLDGSSLFYIALRQQTQSLIVGAAPNSLGGAGDVQIINGVAADLDWTPAEPAFDPVVANYAPLYDEVSEQSDDGTYGLAALQGIDTSNAYLNTRVDDSFNALRLRVIDKTGHDYLAELDSAFWQRDRLPEIGQARQNWHYTGRAFALDRNSVVQGNPTPMVVVRENREIGTYWRVYLRVSEEAQNGSLGEPIRQVPWDFAARTNANDLIAYEQGGKRMESIPSGYYIDFTELANDYGWEPIAADRTWRQNFSGILFWEFVKTDGLDWRNAMIELYTEDELDSFSGTPIPVGPTSTPLIAEPDQPTNEPIRTATPVPPDQQ